MNSRQGARRPGVTGLQAACYNAAKEPDHGT